MKLQIAIVIVVGYEMVDGVSWRVRRGHGEPLNPGMRARRSEAAGLKREHTATQRTSSAATGVRACRFFPLLSCGEGACRLFCGA